MDVVGAIRLSKATIHRIRLNLFFAFIYNMIGMLKEFNYLKTCQDSTMWNHIIHREKLVFISLVIFAHNHKHNQWEKELPLGKLATPVSHWNRDAGSLISMFF